MADVAWNAPMVRSFCVLMVGNAIDDADERGKPVAGDSPLILLNAHHEEVPFALPTTGEKTGWLPAFDTTDGHAEEKRFPGGTRYPLQGRSLVVFTLNGDRRRRLADARRTA
jgi:glycogen operon protein